MIWPEMSVIAVFPLKTGDSMFVGFDSQNTSIYLKEARCPVSEGLSESFQEFSHPG